ncbi:M20 metallopeptidase family protein [Nocardia transvalensis]|uniref:M20 metallopeptidase family protein n=1 Tax=Nocardia transvalensis TaxID=37333 RepID=UPI0018940205|nr:amidohydrolase [Nocardia transvalensis]MBF6331982.1 amidohydrolase [Nocardia transvalensis]
MATPKDGLHEELDRLTGQIEPQVITWRHHLHRNPELPNRETDTARFIADHLNTLGLTEIRTGIAGHGVVGVLEGDQPGNRAMALRADIDALPVRETSGVPFASTVIDTEYPGGPFPVAHACGHDCHTAMLMGAASVLAQVRDRLPGTVLFVFQPAEEGPPAGETGGAAQMMAEEALEHPRPTMVYGHHVSPYPLGHVGYRAGNQFGASCMVKIVVSGRQVHASTPWQGIDPMPAAADIISATGQLYRQMDAFAPVTISIGHIEDVGRFNIIGETVTLWGTVRCVAQSTMDRAQELIDRTADHIARAHGCIAQTSFLQPVPAVNNQPRWVDSALPTFTRVIGPDKLVEVTPTLGYDDVSYFVNTYGGLYVLLGAQDTQLIDGSPQPIPGGRGLAVNHNPAFYADDAVLSTGVRLHTHLTLDHLTGRIIPG